MAKDTTEEKMEADAYAAAPRHICVRDSETGEILYDGDDIEQARSLFAVDEPMAPAAPMIYGTDSLVGDVRDAMLGQFRAAKKPWAQLAEAQQREVAHAFEWAARDMVRSATKLIVAHNFDMTEVAIANANAKATSDELVIECKVVAPYTDEALRFLGGRVTRKAVIVGADIAAFSKRMEAAAVDPDQPDLPMTPEQQEAEALGAAAAAEADVDMDAPDLDLDEVKPPKPKRAAKAKATAPAPSEDLDIDDFDHGDAPEDPEG